jgi:acetolactate synthase-1/2/3 large subunit
MKGAEALLRTLLAGGIDVCFTNPGTSEMQFVAAIDRVPQMRGVLALFEGVATGAADGYARMAGRPAATLLHLGPGLANGLANLHNARRAMSPIVNIVGEHATHHLEYDAPLASDIAGLASPVSAWVHTSASARTIAADTAAAIAAARQPPGQIATLITPADATWDESEGAAAVPDAAPPARADEAQIRAAADALRSGEPALLLMGGDALRDPALEHAGRIAARCRARLSSTTFIARQSRGAGRVRTERLPYFVEPALAALAEVRHLILVGAPAPVAFFAYPGLPSSLVPAGTQVHVLARPGEDLADALARLADAVGASAPAPLAPLQRPGLPSGALDPLTIAQAIAALLPEQCVVVDESATSGWALLDATAGAPPHDWLMLTGGAIGDGLPMATGAAIASPGRRVLALQADGSAAYTMQALWTQAREQLDVTTVIYANRAYRILEVEYTRTESGQRPGPRAGQLMSLAQPELNWAQLARGMGVPATRVETLADFNRTLAGYLREPGPNLIEAMI